MPESSKSRFISAEDLYEMQTLSEVRISPDGRSVVFPVQRIDRKTEKKYSNLWLARPDTGECGSFTWGDQRDTMPRWSPDGEEIVFLSNRGDKDRPPQLYRIPLNGGEARPLGAIPGEIGDIAWAPDGSHIALSVRKFDPEQVERWEDEQKKKLGVVARHYDRLFYKLDGYGYLPKERWHLWIIDTRTGEATQVTDHPVFDEQQPDWTPDSTSVVFVSNRSPDPDQDPDVADLYSIKAQGGELQRIPAPEGPKHHPSISPNGRWVAYYGHVHKDEGYRNHGLWVVPLDGSGEARDLLAGKDLHASPWTISDQSQPELMPPTWTPDSTRLYFPVVLHGASLLMSIGLDGSDLRTEIGQEAVVGSFSFDKSFQRLAYFYATMQSPGQIYIKDLPDGEPKRLTDLNAGLFASIQLSDVQTHWIDGPDGGRIQGWIMTPPDFDPSHQYPSILMIHGGPLTQYGYYFMHEFYYLAAQGFVVSFCNPRGGRGYGEQHAGAIWGGWGKADYDDLMAWADFIATRPFIDPQRMGVGGGSYGGYMTVWIIGHTPRFAAAVAMRCVSNLISMWGSSDYNWTFEQELQTGAPFQDLQKHWDHSPIKYIEAARTPTLVMHNENDLRCPIEQGEQVFVALKRQGLETEFVRFPDEFHGLSRTGRTDRRIARLEHIARWYRRFLSQPEPVAKDA